MNTNLCPRGTRVISGDEAGAFYRIIDRLRLTCMKHGYRPIILPSIWDQQTFIDRAGPEIVDQMYAFKDKGDRDICLIPEGTAIIQKLYREHWQASAPKPIRLFYVQRCYRYERPQAGRYREFTQFGVELLGGEKPCDQAEVWSLLNECLMGTLGQSYTLKPSVARGLAYYTDDGFEIHVESLGAQKQVAGGGRYEGGVGFAIGVDRLCMAIQTSNKLGV